MKTFVKYNAVIIISAIYILANTLVILTYPHWQVTPDGAKVPLFVFAVGAGFIIFLLFLNEAFRSILSQEKEEQDKEKRDEIYQVQDHY